jgi:hypothetical protein
MNKTKIAQGHYQVTKSNSTLHIKVKHLISGKKIWNIFAETEKSPFTSYINGKVHGEFITSTPTLKEAIVEISAWR